MNQVARARAYISKLPPAIEGQGGHNATLSAACRLVEFGLQWQSAWVVLSEWNLTHCKPPWGDGELEHKLKDAFKRTGPQDRFAAGNARSGVAAGRPPAFGVTRPAATTRRHVTLDPVLSKLALIEGGQRQFETLAKLRGLSVESITLASKRGLLRFGEYGHQPAWFILDASQRVAQTRRLDGGRFGVNKALNLKGSDPKWPIGIHEAKNFPSIVLCEGGADMLAALHFIIQQGREADCAPVAMLGAEMPVHGAALPLFSGKRVRIFQHADISGGKAAKRWSESLTNVGATVESLSFHGLSKADGSPVKDLNDLARMSPEDFKSHDHLSFLFP